jgi:hypothetical protein
MLRVDEALRGEGAKIGVAPGFIALRRQSEFQEALHRLFAYRPQCIGGARLPLRLEGAHGRRGGRRLSGGAHATRLSSTQS